MHASLFLWRWCRRVVGCYIFALTLNIFISYTCDISTRSTVRIDDHSFGGGTAHILGGYFSDHLENKKREKER